MASTKIVKKYVGQPRPEGVSNTSTEMKEWALANGKCPETVWPKSRWATKGHLCGNPIKDDDLGLCGVHARPIRERQRAEAERKAKEQRSETNRVKGERLAKAINKALGTEAAHAEYRFEHGTYRVVYTGSVVLSAEAAEALIERLGK